MPNLTSLFAARANLDFHIDAMRSATNNPPQAAIDALVNQTVALDSNVANVLTMPPVPPATGQLDFTAYDKAVADFKNDGRLIQQDVDNVVKVLTVNTK